MIKYMVVFASSFMVVMSLWNHNIPAVFGWFIATFYIIIAEKFKEDLEKIKLKKEGYIDS